MSEAPTSLFSPESGKRTQGELIPKGTLAWVGVTFQAMKNSKESGGQYANFELTILGDGVPHAGRKIWTMICDPYDLRNSDKWRPMAVAAMTRIFEAFDVFTPENPDSYNRFNGAPFSKICEELDGAVAAIKVGLEAGQDGHADKNVVGEWLSPNPVSGGHKDFAKLANPQQAAEVNRAGFLASATAPIQTAVPTEATPVNRPGVAGGVAGGAAGGVSRPAWLSAKPPGCAIRAMPPSTPYDEPVTYEAAGEARNRTTAATSSGVPCRFIATPPCGN